MPTMKFCTEGRVKEKKGHEFSHYKTQTMQSKRQIYTIGGAHSCGRQTQKFGGSDSGKAFIRNQNKLLMINI